MMGYYKMGILPNCFLLLLGEAFNYSLTNYDSPGKFIDYKGNKNKACFFKKKDWIIYVNAYSAVLKNLKISVSLN